jgi:hypothetical protein
MKDALTKVLVQVADDASVDRILAASFFRTRPLQGAGTTAQVVRLDERRAGATRSS